MKTARKELSKEHSEVSVLLPDLEEGFSQEILLVSDWDRQEGWGSLIWTERDERGSRQKWLCKSAHTAAKLLTPTTI